jgi:hypothetical protein
VRKAPALAGEDNDEIYSRILGLSPAEIDDLREQGAI